ncbi:N-formylglutamate amidohydrolase [Novosphingobium sp. Rr 2-17]|uniref:N-formylglutamate amidohydrolase n=1 Tax=Novosphingobium sp. Rr 2-17 TaxID=555793 RepID=UPI000269A77A|nr:N-formylglutamate amidohydrolase [Novosphingobium sp. Rr 2-17]EIZ81327.1 N-formylglutamate amidohydrolase [Novosphingobium sp. Rr 2-17]
MIATSETLDSGGCKGGQIPGAPNEHAFTQYAAQPLAIPVLIAVPHGGRTYPPALLRDLRYPPSMVLRLEDRLIDLVAQGVARATGAALLVAQAPRAMIDLNRGPEDVDWEMFVREARPASGSATPSRRARSGLGLIPRRLPGMGELWRRRLGSEDLAERLDGVHEPYHATLGATLADLRDRWGAALLIDLHSMPPLPAPDGRGGTQIVIGDRFGASCHGSLVVAAFAHLAGCGREAAHNRPYAGGYVLERHAQPRQAIHALQLEIDRSRYLDAALIELGAGVDAMVKDLAGLVRCLAERVSDLGDKAGAWPQAAE